MTHIQKITLIYSIAFGMVVCSFVTWSTFLRNNYANDTIEAAQIVNEEGDPVFNQVHSYPYTITNKKQEFARLDEFSVEHQEPEFFESELDSWELEKRYALSVPSLGIHTPILVPSKKFWNMRQWELLEEQMQVGMRNGAVAYPHSSAPGENGALIIAGHSSPIDEKAKENRFGNIFERLPNVKNGEKVMVTNNGITTVYEVTGAVIVPITETSVLEQEGDRSTLKLITCYPVGSTKDRMVITAHKIDS